MKLIHKIIALALLPLIIGGTIILAVGYTLNKHALTVEAEEHTLLQAKISDQTIRDFFAKHINILVALASSQVLKTDRLADILSQLKQWESKLPEIEALYYNEVDGTVHDSSGMTFSVSDRYYFPAIERGETVITKMIKSRATGEKIVLILVPIFDQNGRRAGALGGTIRVSQIIEHVKNIRFGETGFAILFNREGDIISGPSIEGIAEGKSRSDFIAQVLKQPVRSPNRFSFAGESYFVYLSQIPSTNWTLVLISKEAEVLNKVRRSGLITLAMIAGMFLLAIIIAFALRKTLLVPIQKLKSAQGRINAGDFSARIVVSSDDELGELLRSFNAMADSLDSANLSLRESERRLSTLIGNLQGIVYFCLNDPDWTMNFVSGGALELTGYSPDEFINNSSVAYNDIIHPDDRKYVWDTIQDAIAAIAPYTLEYRIITKKGDVKWVWERGRGIFTPDGELHHLEGFITDITESKWMGDVLRESLSRFKALFNATSDSVILIDPDGTILDLNENAARRRDVDAKAMLGQNLFDFLPPEAADIRRKAVNDVLNEARLVQYEESRYFKDYSIRLFPVINNMGKVFQVASFSRDITERKQAEAEKAKLEAQLQQSQKLESIGRLAGGVAHDFNNMLSVILGFTELAMAKAGSSQSLLADLTEIKKAATRSADLTLQLLAFARKQTISPEMIDLNKKVGGMIKMLRLLIGEDIDLIWKPGTDLWQVKVDPSQIDQILANLCVNARDAVSDVGKITIETKNVVFDEAYYAENPDCIPGEYLRLTVSDNGSGMDKETLGQIFEPFFTTKEMSKGTGLGLAMVYGIVRQNNGFINVYSEPGQGTTFSIYLPRHAGKSEQVQKEGPVEDVVPGNETILIVEDEPAILELATKMLEMYGYIVLAANTPGEAVRIAMEHVGEIQLLMTDVVMPEMNGRDLAKNLLTLYPDLKLLFMSGYTADIIAHRGVLEDDVHFIQKPFFIKDLAVKVREALDQKQSEILS